MFKPSKKRSAAAALVLLGSLVMAGAANAISYVGRFDPDYGDPFDGMYWSGTALFVIPDTPACAGAPGATLTSATCSGMYVTDAVVELRDGVGPVPAFDTLTFLGQVAVSSVTFKLDGNVDSVQSNWFEPLVAGNSSMFNVDDYLFSIGFSSAGARMFHTENDAYLDKHGSHGDKEGVFWNGVGQGHLGELCGPTSEAADGTRCGFSATSAVVTFTPAIPEPHTYALMLAGLAAVGFMARRRRLV